MVSVCEFRLGPDMKREYRKLRETTMRDELEIFSEETICSVCLGVIHANSGITTSCDHYFHEDCLTEWLYVAYKHTCPNCRTLLRKSGIDHYTFTMDQESLSAYQEEESLYSVLDIIESQRVRDRLIESTLNIDRLTERIYQYDVAVELAMIFNGL